MGARENRKRRLTDKTLKSLQANPPKTGRVDWFDTTKAAPPGFGVRVSPTGHLSFFRLYRRGKQLKRWTIGSYPDELDLAGARRAAAELKASEDPNEKKRLDRLQGPFTYLADQFLEAHEPPRVKARVLKEWRRLIRYDLFPEFGEADPSGITKGEIKTFLRRKAKTAPYGANRAFEVLRRIFKWAIYEDLLEQNPCDGLQKPAKEFSRERVLDNDEIRAVFESVKGTRDELPTWLQFLTATRRGEIQQATWCQFDFEKNRWTIPDTKSGRPHVLPLSTKAVELLQAARPTNAKKDDLLFAKWRPDRTLDHIRKETKIKDIRNHDFRRTVSTEIAGLQVRPDVVSRILNHAPGGPAASRIYNRYSYIPEMAAALETWAQHLTALVANDKGGTNVVPFNRRDAK